MAKDQEKIDFVFDFSGECPRAAQDLGPEVLECHHVAGADSYIVTVVSSGLEQLERFLGSINRYGETRTSIVFSTPIARRGLVPPGSSR